MASKNVKTKYNAKKVMINGFERIFVTNQKSSKYNRYRRNLAPMPPSKITTPSRLLFWIPEAIMNQAIRLITVTDMIVTA
jgi:hypothetical protein